MLRRLLAAALLLLLPLPALADGRVALVIGTSRYDQLTDLPNPRSDAAALAEALSDLGFDVTEESNPDTEDLRDALADFAEDAAGADLALVFYAGHGVEIAGENRLLPTDATADSLDSLAATSLPLTDIAQTLATLAPAAILIVDACRNDPFAGTPLADATRAATALEDPALEDPTRPIAPGFARVGPAQGLLYAFSTAPGDVASDGPEGANSPFTAALLRHLAKPGLELRTVLTLVTEDVHDRTRGAQTPYFESGLPELIFAAGQPADLTERDALLLAMADLTPDLRDQVETLAATRAMPLAPLYAALLTLPPDTSRADLDRALTEAADAYASFQDQLALLSEADPRVADLRAQAAQALDLGEGATADALFRQAEALDAAAGAALEANLIARKVSQADTILLRADAARTALDHPAAIAALTEAIALYTEAAPLGLPPEAQAKRSLTLWDLGDLHLLTGDTTAALAAYRDRNALAAALSAASPDDTALLRDLAVSHNNIGDVLVARGDLSAALENFRAGMSITLALAARDPGNSGRQRDLWVSHNKIGDVLSAVGDLTGALDSYRSGMAIARAQTARDPGNLGWQRDVLVGLERIGDVLRAQGDLHGALESYRERMAIAQALVALDPADPVGRRDLSISHSKIGNVLVALGDLPGALQSYRAALDLAHALADQDPANVLWQRDLSVSLEKIGDVLKSQGDLGGAIRSYRQSMAISAALAAQDPGNADWQRDLSISHDRIADVFLAEGDLAAALASFRAGLAIRLALAALDPGNTLWQRDLAVSHSKIGDVLRALGDGPGAQASYRAGMDIARALAALDNGSAQAQLDLVLGHYKLATVSPDPRPELEAALAILRDLQSEGRLPPANEGWISVVEQALATLPPAP